ncbi:peptidoglycan recognition protein family protein [Staphylococcus haemolyticus]|uniref:peptidoglycan recognition protein family protein n=1 Tax=Staphylococcus haemolyticus TaxID=1283 RepID=UPI001F0A5C79|nr:peptidoglycan recognition family protein [Staphylococcus haemolyticus]MCH4326235.1 peptidoglycan recognition protein family protein [Staphylococcus haemolyticus]MCH4419050.1 peptidoglycan recognition protein family protein [Staphylococcus haemolyticus]MCH4456629.1 peptidoglycan recognition protein family protein [Staphylococcus haemolyticus]MCH4489782.1 peptidoglycan recognition protein family protein [Staphylococcus haemolyticus]
MSNNKKFLDTWNGVPVYLDLVPYGTRRTGQKLDTGEPIFAVYHDTGNPGSTAQQNVDYYINTYMQDWASTASAHFFVDDEECIIDVPIDEKAWHVIYDTPKDNYYFGDDANDAAFGGELCYFPDDRERSLKALDNFARVCAVLFDSWNIDHFNKCPGHQDIQDDKQDPGNALEACGYGRYEIEVIDNLVQHYMNGTDIDKDTVTDLPEDDEVIEKKPKGCERVKVWSEEPYCKGTIKYDASLRERAGNSFDNYSFANEIDVLADGTEVYIYEEILDPQGNVWCRTYSPSNNGWVHKDTIEVEETYKD